MSPPNLDAADWEFRYAPYDTLTYETALQYLEQTDIVLDIGAGDLRFARQAAARVRLVIAIEQNAELLQRALAQASLPENVRVICADARSYDFPAGITAGVLLMRHCTHFRLYLEKLRQSGARRLITNARWRMNVEQIDLEIVPLNYGMLSIGFYACRCGAVGFKSGPVEQLTQSMLDTCQEVDGCPCCASSV